MMSTTMRVLSTLALVLLLGQAGPVLAADVLRVHETHGLFMEKWGVREAVTHLKETGYPKAEWSQSYHNQQRHVNELIGFPQNQEELNRHAVIVLNNIPAHALTPAMSTMLKQYVIDGGCIVMMCDTHGKGMSGLKLAGKKVTPRPWRDNALAPLLPVDLKKGTVRVHSPLALPIQPGKNVGSKGLDWTPGPCTFYYHKAPLRSGSRILLKSGRVPLAVEKRTGKGRVIFFLTSVFGDKKEGAEDLPFWEWKDWPSLMAQLLIPAH
jgi:uncharacterized membrane protein